MEIRAGLIVYLPIFGDSLIGKVLYQVSRSHQITPLSPAVRRIMEYSGTFPSRWPKEQTDKSVAVMQHGIETYDPRTYSVN